MHYLVPQLSTIISTTATQASTYTLVQTNPVMFTSLSTNQDTSTASCKFILFCRNCYS